MWELRKCPEMSYCYLRHLLKCKNCIAIIIMTLGGVELLQWKKFIHFWKLDSIPIHFWSLPSHFWNSPVELTCWNSALKCNIPKWNEWLQWLNSWLEKSTHCARHIAGFLAPKFWHNSNCTENLVHTAFSPKFSRLAQHLSQIFSSCLHMYCYEDHLGIHRTIHNFHRFEMNVHWNFVHLCRTCTENFGIKADLCQTYWWRHVFFQLGFNCDGCSLGCVKSVCGLI